MGSVAPVVGGVGSPASPCMVPVHCSGQSVTDL